jgi:hypothetical protein
MIYHNKIIFKEGNKMKNITINKMNFMIDLFSDYKNKLYTHMRKDEYSIDTIMSFINGYMLVEDKITDYVIDIEMFGDNSVAERFEEVIFNDHTDLLKEIDLKIIYSIKYMEYNYKDKWEKIGVKYALNLIKFYVENVLSGNDTKMLNGLYFDIPDKNTPELYNWETHGGFDINI